MLRIFWGVSGKSEAIRTDHRMAVWSIELANNRNQKREIKPRYIAVRCEDLRPKLNLENRTHFLCPFCLYLTNHCTSITSRAQYNLEETCMSNPHYPPDMEFVMLFTAVFDWCQRLYKRSLTIVGDDRSSSHSKLVPVT